MHYLMRRGFSRGKGDAGWLPRDLVALHALRSLAELDLAHLLQSNAAIICSDCWTKQYSLLISIVSTCCGWMGPTSALLAGALTRVWEKSLLSPRF